MRMLTLSKRGIRPGHPSDMLKGHASLPLTFLFYNPDSYVSGNFTISSSRRGVCQNNAASHLTITVVERKEWLRFNVLVIKTGTFKC